jgi:gas vesicle protein
MKAENPSEELPAEPIVEDASARSSAGFVAGVLFGAFLGAAFALLFAPDRGEKTRGRVARRLKTLREDAREGIDRASQRTKKEIRRRRRILEAQLERARERAEDALDRE